MWSHPLIGPSSSGLVEELHGPGMSASSPSDQNCHWWTGVCEDKDVSFMEKQDALLLIFFFEEVIKFECL